MRDLEVGQQLRLRALREDERGRLVLLELLRHDVAQASGINDQAAGIELLTFLDLGKNDAPVILPEALQADNSSHIVDNLNGDADSRGAFASQVPSGDEAALPGIGRGRDVALLDGVLIRLQGAVDVLGQEDLPAIGDELPHDVLLDRELGEVTHAVAKEVAGDKGVVAAVATLEVALDAAVTDAPGMAAKPVGAIGSGDQVEAAVAVSKAHLDNLLHDVLGVRMESDLIEDEQVAGAAQEVLAAVLGGAGLNGGAGGEDQFGVGAADKAFDGGAKKRGGVGQANDVIKDDVGLVLGQGGGDDVEVRSGVASGAALAVEGLVQNLDGADEGFAPAVAGGQDVLAFDRVFEPLDLGGVEGDVEDLAGEVGVVVLGADPVDVLGVGLNRRSPTFERLR